MNGVAGRGGLLFPPSPGPCSPPWDVLPCLLPARLARHLFGQSAGGARRCRRAGGRALKGGRVRWVGGMARSGRGCAQARSVGEVGGVWGRLEGKPTVAIRTVGVGRVVGLVGDGVRAEFLEGGLGFYDVDLRGATAVDLVGGVCCGDCVENGWFSSCRYTPRCPTQCCSIGVRTGKSSCPDSMHSYDPLAFHELGGTILTIPVSDVCFPMLDTYFSKFPNSSSVGYST